jgi:hypothetical protein
MTRLNPSATGSTPRRRARPAFILSAVIGLVILFAGMQPAHAFTVSFNATCTTSGGRFIAVTLDEPGPGSFTDSEGTSGTFGPISEFSYDILNADATSLTLNIAWDTGETASMTSELSPCQAPTTTTAPPTPTTAPPPGATTTTVATPGGTPTPTTVPTNVLAAQTAPAGTLAATGGPDATTVFAGALLIAVGALGVAVANRRARKQ